MPMPLPFCPSPGRRARCARAAFVSFVAMTAFIASARAAPQADAAATLEQEARLATILQLAVKRNPDLAEEQERVALARTRTEQAGRLGDPQLKYEHWGVPLRRPFALGEANALMVGISQTLPAPGARAARTRMASQEAATAASSAAIRRRELRAQVRRAFADYYRADRELRLHREHVDLTARLVELARGSYRAGHRAQQDVLRLGLELSRLHRDLAHIEQERISAQALLNALMNRPVDANLGPPEEIDAASLTLASPSPPSATAPAPSPAPTRPELDAALASLRRSEAALDLAEKEGHWPSVTLGADYMYMPLMHDPHGYGAMVMFNLPWLSGARRDAVKGATQSVNADRHALESVRNVVGYELRDARARHTAARSTLTIVDNDLLPQAQRNFDAAYSAYAAGQGDAISLIDALRSYLDVRLDRIRALVHLATTFADLTRVAGETTDRP
jgi:outer membrane protein, heavy metal efflux system